MRKEFLFVFLSVILYEDYHSWSLMHGWLDIRKVTWCVKISLHYSLRILCETLG